MRSHPTSTTETLLGVHCRANDAFAVGGRGTVLRWDGTAWRSESSGTEEKLNAVTGDTNGTVIAVGGELHIGGDSLILVRKTDGTIAIEPAGMQHILLTISHGPMGWLIGGYNGGILLGGPGAWSRVDVVHYAHVFASWVGEAHAMVAGLGGSVVLFDGTTWRPLDTGADVHLRALAAFDELDIVAVGLSGVILRFDGKRWSPMSSPTENHLESVWVAGPKEAWAVGHGGTVLRFDGARWRTVDMGGAQPSLRAVHGNERGVIAVGGGGVALHFER